MAYYIFIISASILGSGALIALMGLTIAAMKDKDIVSTLILLLGWMLIISYAVLEFQ